MVDVKTKFLGEAWWSNSQGGVRGPLKVSNSLEIIQVDRWGDEASQLRKYESFYLRPSFLLSMKFVSIIISAPQKIHSPSMNWAHELTTFFAMQGPCMFVVEWDNQPFSYLPASCISFIDDHLALTNLSLAQARRLKSPLTSIANILGQLHETFSPCNEECRPGTRVMDL